jgi:hypothetical protein
VNSASRGICLTTRSAFSATLLSNGSILCHKPKKCSAPFFFNKRIQFQNTSRMSKSKEMNNYASAPSTRGRLASVSSLAGAATGATVAAGAGAGFLRISIVTSLAAAPDLLAPKPLSKTLAAAGAVVASAGLLGASADTSWGKKTILNKINK